MYLLIPIFNENIIFLIELRESSKIVSLLAAIGSLRNHDDDNNKDVTNFAYLIVKNNSFARCPRAVFIFDISQTFSFFLRREMICFAGVWTT